MEKQKHDTDNNSGENFTEGEEGTGARWSVPDRGARAPRGAAQAASCAAHPCSPRVPTTHITPLSGAESRPRTPRSHGQTPPSLAPGANPPSHPPPAAARAGKDLHHIDRVFLASLSQCRLRLRLRARRAPGPRRANALRRAALGDARAGCGGCQRNRYVE
jgi:hypothetical protein